MIYQALKIIRDELGQFLELQNQELNVINNQDVILDNVSTLEGNNRSELQGKIIISLVNIEEESALKNTMNYQRTPNGLRYENPPVHLNLYILFCSNFSEEEDAYQIALQQLSFIIEFFQSKNIFTVSQASNSTITLDPNDPDLTELRVMLDLYTLTFEQINHLWGSLGGKQVPFVMYKARLLKIRGRRPLGSGELVREIHSQEDIR